MKYSDILTIGVNHHLLCKFLIRDAASHAETLLPLLSDQRYDHFDLWIVGEEPYRSRELAAIRECGRPVIYNVGDRDGEPELFPCAADPSVRARTLDAFKSEIDRGLLADTKKIVTSSGKPQGEIESCFERLVDFYCRLCEFVPREVEILIEPTDTDFDKCFYIGSSFAAAKLVKGIKRAGFSNIGSMMDMCHLAPLGETPAGAFKALGDFARHVHLGTCVLENRQNPYYGDKHPAWGLPDVCWGEEELAELISSGLKAGYFGPQKGTASFEMVAYDDIPYLQSSDRFFEILEKAMTIVNAEQ